jgi:NAD(P)-dependent dehydrogenase (short-subunit alcohol dehydrogenase family)
MEAKFLEGKACLVTGGSRALGASIVRSLVANGADVALTYREDAKTANALCEELEHAGVRIEVIQADVTDQAAVLRLISGVRKAFGKIDILINNVGPYSDIPFLELSYEDFDHVMSANVRATYLSMKVAGSHMKAQGSGHIINVSATDAFHRSSSVYSLAKSGVIHLTQALALELAPEVRVNSIAPDLIADNEGMTSELEKTAVQSTPIGRLVSRDEIAGVVSILCSPIFDIVTGQTIVLDGGRSISQRN